jgi:hypothetical protein
MRENIRDFAYVHGILVQKTYTVPAVAARPILVLGTQ